MPRPDRGPTGEDLRRNTMRPSTPTDEVLSRVGDAMTDAMTDAASGRSVVYLQDNDGDPVMGDLEHGYKLQLYASGCTLKFPSADRAGEHAEEIREALAILNRALGRAHDAFATPLPEPVDCAHLGLRVERGPRDESPIIPYLAVCPTCNTVVVHDLLTWAEENGHPPGTEIKTIVQAVESQLRFVQERRGR